MSLASLAALPLAVLPSAIGLAASLATRDPLPGALGLGIAACACAALAVVGARSGRRGRA